MVPKGDAYLAGSIAGPASRLPLATDDELYELIRRRTRLSDVDEPMAPIVDYTLVECLKDGNVLLGYKKRGFGVGKFNGFGGKFEIGETAEDCARRELKEEAGIDAASLQWAAQLLFTFRDSPKLMRVHVFLVHHFTGQPTETNEMKPQWFPLDKLPLDQMWHDDTFWLAPLLSGAKFHAWFDYLPGGEKTNRVAGCHLTLKE